MTTSRSWLLHMLPSYFRPRHPSPNKALFLSAKRSPAVEISLKDSLCPLVELCKGGRMEPTTRRSLVLRLRNLDDETAWTEFVEIYEPLVYRLARRKGLQEADARDVCQDVFRAVATAIERWDPDPAKGKFRSWLFRIARNLVVNFLSRQGRLVRGSGRTSVQELLEAQPAADAAAQAEFAAEFRQ